MICSPAQKKSLGVSFICDFPNLWHFDPAIICDFSADTVYNFYTNTKLQFEPQPLFTIALLVPKFYFKLA